MQFISTTLYRQINILSDIYYGVARVLKWLVFY